MTTPTTFTSRLKAWLSQQQAHLPVLVVILVGLIIAFQNIDPTTHYAGWDNILATFNLRLYAQRVLSGAWLEHQGPGAPAGLAHLSELTRLPILFILKLLLPDNLVRYVFIFGMYLTGGIGMYLYLHLIWINQNLTTFKSWLAASGRSFLHAPHSDIATVLHCIRAVYYSVCLSPIFAISDSQTSSRVQSKKHPNIHLGSISHRAQRSYSHSVLPGHTLFLDVRFRYLPTGPQRN